MNIETIYARSNHVCRHCLGPILQHEGGYVCAVCDASAKAVDGICGCGIKVASSGANRVLFRCTANPARGPASPSAFVISFGAGQVDEALAGAGQCS